MKLETIDTKHGERIEKLQTCLRRRAYSIGRNEHSKVRTSIRGILNQYAKRWRQAKREDINFKVRELDFNKYPSEKVGKKNHTNQIPKRPDRRDIASGGVTSAGGVRVIPTDGSSEEEEMETDEEGSDEEESEEGRDDEEEETEEEDTGDEDAPVANILLSEISDIEE